jgi:hypothetical protein
MEKIKLPQEKKSDPEAGNRLIVFRVLGGILGVAMLVAIGIEFAAQVQVINFWNLVWAVVSLYVSFLFIAFAFNGYRGAQAYTDFISKKIFRRK